MVKGLKVLYSLIGLILLTVLGNVIFINQRFLNLPSLSWLPVDYYTEGFWKDVLAQYFLWAAVVLFVLVVIAILVIIFFPRRYSEVKLPDGDGKLNLKKSAIEGYVKSLIKSEKIMKNASVSVNVYKKKFKIDVKGNIIPRTDVVEQIDQLKKKIESGIDSFFGVKRKVNFKVKVKDISDNNNNKQRVRVE